MLLGQCDSDSQDGSSAPRSHPHQRSMITWAMFHQSRHLWLDANDDHSLPSNVLSFTTLPIILLSLTAWLRIMAVCID